MTLDEAFGLGDQVLMQGVRGISEIILKPGFINVDFCGCAYGTGERRHGCHGHR